MVGLIEARFNPPFFIHFLASSLSRFSPSHRAYIWTGDASQPASQAAEVKRVRLGAIIYLCSFIVIFVPNRLVSPVPNALARQYRLTTPAVRWWAPGVAEEREREHAQCCALTSDPSSLTFTLRSFLPSFRHLLSPAFLSLPFSLRGIGITSRACNVLAVFFAADDYSFPPIRRNIRCRSNRYRVFSYFNATFFPFHVYSHVL